MESNFEFLKDDMDTQGLYEPSQNIEKLYAEGHFDSEIEAIRKVIENVASMILDFNFVRVPERSTFNDKLQEIKKENLATGSVLNMMYDLKSNGNIAAHTFHKYTDKEALDALKQMYLVLVWFANTYMNQHQDMDSFNEPHEDTTYSTSEKKLIYIQSNDNKNGLWLAYEGAEKIGDASIPGYEMDNRPNSDDLRKSAEKRINQYMKTSGVPYNLDWAELAYRESDNTWFRDTKVHDVLLRSGVHHAKNVGGEEWFETDVETAKKAIRAVKEGKVSIDAPIPSNEIKIILRPEQKDAVKQTESAFSKTNRMLWNAKMRFGKTLTALQLIKEEKYQKVLIMTHRPVVSDSWFDDFHKIQMNKSGYLYGSKDQGEDAKSLANCDKPFIYFASIQDLRGSLTFGGTISDKNQWIADTNWDLVIIDEAHEGTQTDLAQGVIKGVVKGDTKLLELSGTPFNLLDKYKDGQVFTWDYVMEQRAKADWGSKHPDQHNPYEGLPRVSMYTFDIRKSFKSSRFLDIDHKSFNFKEFFKVNDLGRFVYESNVNQFLNNITTQNGQTNYPFSTQEFRDNLRHTLWILPGIKEAKALENLMHKHPVFGKEYTIVNAVDKDDKIENSEGDLQRVRRAITNDPSSTRTITLTVRKLTTGINVPEWTGVVFLSNTNSAMQYLQAAFRAQTPYSDKKTGMKTNCYIFDFAPDRALTVMAESAQMTTGAGKIVNSVQKDKMNQLLNFMPIIGETGNGMKKFKVDTLLSKIKRVYAEKAVRSGFDDDSLYSDELLKLDFADLSEFNDLKAIVGTTKAEKKPVKIDVNDQGLTDEEYDDAIHGEDKQKKERTPEEQAALDKMNELKKQRKTMVSILRSISIRIPMMIYGMDIDIDKDVDIYKFVQLVDDKSWKEFMPVGVTKELFRNFIKYYDQDIFVEAGRIIRQRVKKLDDEDPIERAEQLALIFGTFRNPDKETVLTPWRVVNMQLGKTIGGLSFFDNSYEYSSIDGRSAQHWINTEYTKSVFDEHSNILEINSKTGLYPLYAALSIYFQDFKKMDDETAGKFSFEDELFLWQRILRENIFVIAKTPMAKTIAQRTLVGYRDMDTNIVFINDFIEKAQVHTEQEVHEIERIFGIMKFDVVIGNPPYQDEAVGDNESYTRPVYNLFMDLSFKLGKKVTLITPARFLFGAGSTPRDWTERILSDKHFKVVKFEPNSSKVFPHTDIKGGIAITYWDSEKEYTPIKEAYAPAGIYIPFEELVSIMHKVTNGEFEGLNSIIYAPENYKFTEKMHNDFPEARERLSKGHDYDLKSNVFDKLPEIFLKNKPNDGRDYIEIYGLSHKKRTFRFIRCDYVTNKTNLTKYKVFVPKANGSGALGEVISTPLIGKPLIGKPLIGNTQTFISIGSFDEATYANAVLKYIKTKFCRVLLGILKVTQDNTANKWSIVPMQDFSPESDINWAESIPNINRQLYKKYNLTPKEIAFIESKVQEMN
ncbi:MAG: Eco57I restriction-modification methylase domain-containing protein [Lentilactobacillus sunkii]|jgi:superfamily II DNA or RNA helicase|uniref:Eco57I restriction-modification methylase domain-containing protein n=1 Tax=Lentilactobacillus sunkii TaxID=481719 RepID=UPI002F35DABD